MPSYATPLTPTAGHKLTAAELKVITDDILVLGTRCGGQWRRTTNQPISNNTLTDLSWDTEDADSDGFLTPPSATATIPAGKAGLYGMVIQGAFSAALGASALFQFVAGGVTYRGVNPGSSTSDLDSWSVSPIPLNAGDTVKVQMLQASGGSINFIGGRFFLHRVGL